jgi:hypothetical protein
MPVPVRQCDPMRGRLLRQSGVHLHPLSGPGGGERITVRGLVLVVVMVRLPWPLLFHPTDQ